MTRRAIPAEYVKPGDVILLTSLASLHNPNGEHVPVTCAYQVRTVVQYDAGRVVFDYQFDHPDGVEWNTHERPVYALEHGRRDLVDRLEE